MLTFRKTNALPSAPTPPPPPSAKKPIIKKPRKEKPREPQHPRIPLPKPSDNVPPAPPLPPKDFLTGTSNRDGSNKWGLTSPNITLPPTLPLSNTPTLVGKGVDVKREDGDQWLWLEENGNQPNVVVFPKP